MSTPLARSIWRRDDQLRPHRTLAPPSWVVAGRSAQPTSSTALRGGARRAAVGGHRREIPGHLQAGLGRRSRATSSPTQGWCEEKPRSSSRRRALSLVEDGRRFVMIPDGASERTSHAWKCPGASVRVGPGCCARGNRGSSLASTGAAYTGVRSCSALEIFPGPETPWCWQSCGQPRIRSTGSG